MHDPYRYVQARSSKDITFLANQIREILLIGDGRVSMAPLLEFVLPDLIKGYDFQVVDDSELAGAEGLTDISKPVIRMANSKYEDLLKADPRARFTAAHELGHLLMHSNSHVHYARIVRADRRSDPEWQANEFAAAFLMPEAAFRQTSSIEEAMTRFGVGYKAAKWRAQSLRHRFKINKKKGHGMNRAP